METKIEHHFGNKVIKIEDIKEFQKQKKEQQNRYSSTKKKSSDVF